MLLDSISMNRLETGLRNLPMNVDASNGLQIDQLKPLEGVINAGY